MHPDLEYVLVETPNRSFILAEGLYEEALKRYGMEGKVIAKAKGEAFKGLRFKHPLAALDPFYDRFSPVLLADYVESTSGTGIVPLGSCLRCG